jgi:hypothetical protein
VTEAVGLIRKEKVIHSLQRIATVRVDMLEYSRAARSGKKAGGKR